MRLASILTINPRMGPLTYIVPDGMAVDVGSLVMVPLSSRLIAGVVQAVDVRNVGVDSKKLKAIAECVLLPPISNDLIQLIDWTADYYICEPSAVLKMVLASGVGLAEPKRAKAVPPIPDPTHAPPVLSEAQAAAAHTLTSAVSAHMFMPFLLDGVTGSGKTEVYFEAIAAALESGKQALVLLPEIALTAPFLARFEARFGCAPAHWHSEMTPAQRRKTFRAIATGAARVVVGARSALFLPYPELGLIVVDEAHETSFKQEEGVPYHARDVAVMRARFEGVPVVLATATPALETRHQVALGHYHEVKLPSRFGGASLPDIKALDLLRDPPPRGQWLAPYLVNEIEQRLISQEQSLLFLNRRGFAPLTLCRTCGHRFQCPNCTTWMVEHRAIHRLQCHHCGHIAPPPRACPECGDEDSLVACGPGVERIAEEVAQRFPDARVAMATSDTLSTSAKVAAFVDDMTTGNIDIVVGTQLVTKGYHFPNLTLVGVVDADLGLQGGDLRASERSFQQIMQVAGRAGRAEKPGQVFLQTHDPQAPVIKALLSGDVQAFYAAESEARRSAGAPPFGRYGAIVISSEVRQTAEHLASAMGRSAPRAHDIHVYGPAPAPLAILRGRHRFRLLVHAKRTAHIQGYIRAWLDAQVIPRDVRITIDIDPYSFV